MVPRRNEIARLLERERQFKPRLAVAGIAREDRAQRRDRFVEPAGRAQFLRGPQRGDRSVRGGARAGEQDYTAGGVSHGHRRFPLSFASVS
ncbi:MAG: hypothetical protein OHK0044_15900 [Burkholderiaceae bacterium]